MTNENQFFSAQTCRINTKNAYLLPPHDSSVCHAAWTSSAIRCEYQREESCLNTHAFYGAGGSKQKSYPGGGGEPRLGGGSTHGLFMSQTRLGPSSPVSKTFTPERGNIPQTHTHSLVRERMCVWCGDTQSLQDILRVF